jgi:hypothetical protein
MLLSYASIIHDFVKGCFLQNNVSRARFYYTNGTEILIQEEDMRWRIIAILSIKGSLNLILIPSNSYVKWFLE